MPNDPRGRKPSKPFGLVTERQFGIGGGQDGINSQTEDNRRKSIPEPEPKSEERKPARISRPRNPPPPPPFIPQTDRFHKGADTYITVANPHVITPDTIRLPGQFESVQTAINFAVSDIIPSFTAEQRVAIIVHGGQYDEDVEISSEQIDLYGLGRPRINGTLTCDVGVNRFLVEGFELYGGDTYAVDLPAYTDPNGDEEAVIFHRCFIHSQDTAYRSKSRSLVARSRIKMDYIDEDYNNLVLPAVQIYGGAHAHFTEFYRCRIEGAPDRRPVLGDQGFPNRGMAWHAIGKLDEMDPTYIDYGDTGVVFRYCTVLGYGFNEVWQVEHEHCQCYGGKKHETAGEVYSFNAGYGSEALTIKGRLIFDHTGVACRYITQEGDMGLGFGKVTELRLQHFKQQMNSGALAGSTMVPAPTVFTGFGAAPVTQGDLYGEHSITWREFFNYSGVAELGILCNCDDETMHHVNTNFAFGAGALGTILQNTYRD